MATYAPPIPKAYKLFKYKEILYTDCMDCCYQNPLDDPGFIKQYGIYVAFTTKAEYYNYIAQHTLAKKQQANISPPKKQVRFLNREPASSQS